MKAKLWSAGLLTFALGMAFVPNVNAACPVPCPAPCPVKCPAPCPPPCPEKPCCPIQKVERCPKPACPTRVSSREDCCNRISSNAACPLSGTVSQGQTTSSGWGVREKTLVLAPGQGQFSIDNLGLFNRLDLTLINPTDEPLKFETTQRLGEEKSWVIPAHSEQVVSMRYTHPFSDEVKFLVSQEPGYAMAHGGCCPKYQAAEVIPAPMPVIQPQPQTTFVVPVAPKTRSTIRGFW